MSKTFIDSNILVYAADEAEPDKKGISQALLATLKDGLIGVVSTQVMQEFYVAAVKKLGIDPLVAKSLLHAMRKYEVVLVDAALIEEAVDCSILNQLSFWDALMVVAAEKARCDRILTEDLSHGQVIRGVRIENPFQQKADWVNDGRKR